MAFYRTLSEKQKERETDAKKRVEERSTDKESVNEWFVNVLFEHLGFRTKCKKRGLFGDSLKPK